MGVTYNNFIPRDQLKLNIDAANYTCNRGRRSNILDWDAWVDGDTGSAISTGKMTYVFRGSIFENERIIDTNPWGNDDVVWKSISESPGTDEGAWDTNIFPVDHTKMYRFSVWMKCISNFTADFYLGLRGYSDGGSTNNGVLQRSNGITNTSPYFEINNNFNQWSENNLNTWYLVVGHVWPSGSGTGSAHVDTGVYKVDGTKLTGNDALDFVWQTNNVYSKHRVYHLSATNTYEEQRYYHPRVDLCDGNELSVSELLAGVDAQWRDISGSNSHADIYHNPYLTTDSFGNDYFTLNGTSHRMTVPASLIDDVLTAAFTWEFWCRPHVVDGNNRFFYCLTESSANRNVFFYSNINLGISHDNTIYNFGNSGAFAANQWHQVVLVHDDTNNTAKVYINGSLLNSVSMTTSISTQSYTVIDLYVDNDGSSNYNQHFDGDMAITRLWQKALSDVEIKQSFNAHRKRFGL